MQRKSDHRAVIIGGSLGGLFNAIALRAIGWEVDIYERSTHELNSRGGGIVLQPDVERIVEIAGMSDRSLGVVSKERIFLDRDGSVLRRVPMRQPLTSWPMLYKTMRKAIPDLNYHLGARLVSIETESDDRVTAVFADGRRATGDLLIGADGVNSTVRAIKMAGVTPRYAGYVAWRGLVKEGELDQATSEMLIERFVFHQFRESHILQYLVPSPDGSVKAGDRYFNWVWYRNVEASDLPRLLTDRTGHMRATSVPPGLVQEAAIQELHHAARQMLAPQMSTLVLATEEPFIQVILDLSVEKMVFGRALLTGDAAFVPRPHTAASTSKAAANAIDLARALTAPEDHLDDALKSWERDQLQLGYSLAWQGQRLGNRSQFPDRVR